MKLPTHLEYTLNYFNLKNKQIDIDKVINVYFYGSHVYKTDTKNSDFDYIIIYVQDIDVSDTLIADMSGNILNATLISPTHFQKMIDSHRIDAIECLFVSEDWKYETIKFDFVLDLVQLRKSISAVCSNSWVKCKKKIKIGEDYIGKKSLFHSLRIADYGIQIAKYSKIISFDKPDSKLLSQYSSYKDLLDEILGYTEWNDLKNKYQELANNLRSEFRIVAPIK
jgi:predicted nucleotidyltransferase